MIHDGQKWNLGTSDEIKNVLDHVVTYSKTKLEEYGEKKNLSDEGKNRLKRIDDAIKKCDEDYIDELKEKADTEENNKPILEKIKDCEEFVNKTKDKIKNIAYNQGKTLKLRK
jgi:DNA topoisomerase VI subunit B